MKYIGALEISEDDNMEVYINDDQILVGYIFNTGFCPLHAFELDEYLDIDSQLVVVYDELYMLYKGE